MLTLPSLAFGVLGDKVEYNRAAILEWTISLIYILYILSFIMDFLPAVHSKHNRFPDIREMGQHEVNGPSVSGGPVYSETFSNNSDGSGQPMQQTSRYNISADAPPSRNF